MMLATRIIHIYQVFVHTLLSKGCSCMAKMDAFRLLPSRRFYSSMSSSLCSISAVKMAVVKNIPLVKSGEDNQ